MQTINEKTAKSKRYTSCGSLMTSKEMLSAKTFLVCGEIEYHCVSSERTEEGLTFKVPPKSNLPPSLKMNRSLLCSWQTIMWVKDGGGTSSPFIFWCGDAWPFCVTHQKFDPFIVSRCLADPSTVSLNELTQLLRNVSALCLNQPAKKMNRRVELVSRGEADPIPPTPFLVAPFARNMI